VFKPELIRPVFKLETGDVYKESKIKKGFDKLRDAYGSLGYFSGRGVRSASPIPRASRGRHPDMDEDKKYYVGRSPSPATPPRATR